jgi:hypothetical protein
MESVLGGVRSSPSLDPYPWLSPVFIRSQKKTAYADTQSAGDPLKIAEARYDGIAVHCNANIEKAASYKIDFVHRPLAGGLDPF